MYKLTQVFNIAGYNFRQWKKNPRVIAAFVLTFVLCLFLADKALGFQGQYGTNLQVMEPFVWAYGDASSIMLISMLLILLFADLPFLTPATPYYLFRTSRSCWLWGQVLYITLATVLHMVFTLATTALISMPRSFAGNMWSETGALLGYSGVGKQIALPASVKTMELSTPYQCAVAIFLLMTLYILLIAILMLAVNLRFGQFWGILSVFIFSLYGLLLNPQTIQNIFRISSSTQFKANVIASWLSPLNHATYHMHNFGYDLLPRVWASCLVFVFLIALLLCWCKASINKYSFSFANSEQ